MALFELLSDTPKDKVSVLRYRKQMAEDARKLGPKEFDEKYKSLDAEDRKAFLPNSKWGMGDTYNYFKQVDPVDYDKQIGFEEKRIQMRTAEDDKITSQARAAAPQVKEMVQGYVNLNKIKGDAEKQFGFKIGETVDPRQVVADGMVSEANQRINQQQGIPLWYDMRNKNTCINGVCTIASNQGVDFSGMKGRDANTLKNPQGQYIPVQNKSFVENLAYSGYEPIPAGESPKPGDFAQYFTAKGSLGELTPEHAEIVLNTKDTKDGFSLETFNNYGLTNSGDGLSGRAIKRTNEGRYTSAVGDWDDVRFYRLTPEAAEKAVMKKNPDIAKKIEGKRMFEQSGMYKSYQDAQQAYEKGRGKNILGDDQGLFMEIVEGAGGQFAKDKDALKKSILSKAKNPKFVERVIDQIYSE